MLDRRMLELTESLHTPCDVCKPASPSAAAPKQPAPKPGVDGPVPPSPPTVEHDAIP